MHNIITRFLPYPLTKRGDKGKNLDASSLGEAMEQRAEHYKGIRQQFTEIRKTMQDITDLDDFEGQGASAIKSFF